MSDEPCKFFTYTAMGFLYWKAMPHMVMWHCGKTTSLIWVQGPVSIYDKTSYREISWILKLQDWYFELSYHYEIWQAHQQQCCRGACQISERSDNSKHKSHSFETSQDVTIKRLIGYWNGDLVSIAWTATLVLFDPYQVNTKISGQWLVEFNSLAPGRLEWNFR